MMGEIALAAGDCRLVLAPGHGGSVSRFDWRGQPVFRPSCGPSMLDTACFPLVPFSNRIAHGRFYDGDRAVRLAPNFPGSDHAHPLHGFGWLAAWHVVRADEREAVLRHDQAAGEWPWSYVAEQRFTLRDDGLRHALSLTNTGASPMPAGLGVHPYFPCDAATVYHGLHRVEWTTAADGLPLSRTVAPEPRDWWDGRPVASRRVDTVYQDRGGPLSIAWPDRHLAVSIEPSPELGCTVVYTPPGLGFFCVEPVSHVTDAVNLPIADTGLRRLAAGETMRAHVVYRVWRSLA